MDCKTIMAPIKVRLYTDQMAGTAIDFMVENHMGLVPVTKRDGTFAGMVSGDHLMKFLLPRSLSSLTGGSRHKGFSLHKRASYLNESAFEMQERLTQLRGRPIAELLDSAVKIARLDTPVIDALMMIKDKQYVIPVVDDDHKLVGAISFFSVLHMLDEMRDPQT